MNIDQITPSTLKIIASENLNIQNDLQTPESSKSLEQLLNEQEKTEEENG